jgi:regulator of replication initiation timing
MAILKVNERTVEHLQLEIGHLKKEKDLFRRDNDSLRDENSMLREVLADLTSTESYWNNEVSTKTMLWRIKNLLNNLNNG